MPADKDRQEWDRRLGALIDAEFETTVADDNAEAQLESLAKRLGDSHAAA